jgi:hypothetical protein
MILHLQSSLENKEYEAAANFVGHPSQSFIILCLTKKDITASDSEKCAVLFEFETLFARVVPGRAAILQHLRVDVSAGKYVARFFQVQRRFLLVHRGTHFCENISKIHRSGKIYSQSMLV